MEKDFCRDCVCLKEENKKWVCDEHGKNIEDIDVCCESEVIKLEYVELEDIEFEEGW